jgi:hypothetical protein
MPFHRISLAVTNGYLMPSPPVPCDRARVGWTLLDMARVCLWQVGHTGDVAVIIPLVSGAPSVRVFMRSRPMSRPVVYRHTGPLAAPGNCIPVDAKRPGEPAHWMS